AHGGFPLGPCSETRGGGCNSGKRLQKLGKAGANAQQLGDAVGRFAVSSSRGVQEGGRAALREYAWTDEGRCRREAQDASLGKSHKVCENQRPLEARLRAQIP
ncbi:unnamed protein product, partial [Symbiodinium sp. KB8]